MTTHACRTFGEELRDLLIAKGFTNGTGNAYWASLAAKLEDVHYETLRKAIAREREPSPSLMEKCAAALGEEPEAFSEYRLYKVRSRFDPKVGGIKAALAALEAEERRG